jgi:hypothetical protein
MRKTTFFPVIPHFLADKGIWIFAPNVAARADIAPSRQHFFHFHLRILSLGALACRIKKVKMVDFLTATVVYAIPIIKGMRFPLAPIIGLPSLCVVYQLVFIEVGENYTLYSMHELYKVH